MSRISLSGLALALVVFQVACSSNSSSSTGPTTGMVVTDTLGKVYSVSCSTSLCTLTPKDANLKPLSCDFEQGGTDAFALLYGTRLLTVHALLVPTSGNISLNAAEPARPVACATDADCLPDLFTKPFTCQNAICQYIGADMPMQTVDVIALCQADLPWPTSCPYLIDPTFAGRMAKVGALCGSASDCAKVPPECRQPTAPEPAPATGLDASAPPSTTPLDAGAQAVDSGS
jgi:hypothetical protein